MAEKLLVLTLWSLKGLEQRGQRPVEGSLFSWIPWRAKKISVTVNLHACFIFYKEKSPIFFSSLVICVQLNGHNWYNLIFLQNSKEQVSFWLFLNMRAIVPILIWKCFNLQSSHISRLSGHCACKNCDHTNILSSSCYWSCLEFLFLIPCHWDLLSFVFTSHMQGKKKVIFSFNLFQKVSSAVVYNCPPVLC